MNHLTFHRVPSKFKALAIVMVALVITIISNQIVALAGQCVPKP